MPGQAQAAQAAARAVGSSSGASRRALDAKWAARWVQSPPHKAKVPNKGPWYQLSMFPYPSGNLHIGHLRVYTISDSLSRFRRMSGYDVLQPIGWDAFGLPAENAAIERGVSPAAWTYSNIDSMREQLAEMLPSFNWDAEVVTCSPDYYKHTQAIFLKLFEAGLAYRQKALVNWDPVEKSVLANEQVDAEGRSWRSGAVVEKRELEQWFLKITEFARELESDLGLLTQWPEKVKMMQKNWIKLSEGAEISFEPGITAYTTRADTLSGVQFIALAVNHPLVRDQEAKDNYLAEYCVGVDPTELSGYKLDVTAVNPLTGEILPVYAASYVVQDYGTGAVMGVPAHDARDFKFWQAYGGGEPARPVLEVPANEDPSLPYLGSSGTLNATAGDFAGLSSDKASAAIIEFLASKGAAKPVSNTRLRDWLISRQRYWGAPIPIVHCDTCGPVAVPESELPVILPEQSDASPLSKNAAFLETTCPKCGGKAHRDPDTMDTFMDSSWYYFRYTDPHNPTLPFAYEAASERLPVDMYVGGVEHAILHLLYSRFLSKFLAKAGMWSGGPMNAEPFKQLVTLGMVHGKTYLEPDTGRFLKPDELDKDGVIIATGVRARTASEKMSKSKHNGVNPHEVIEKYGADATRAHILFQAPVPDVLDWDEAKIVGVERWIAKVGSLVDRLPDSRAAPSPGTSESVARDAPAWNEMQDLVASISTSFGETLALNTVVSDLMKYTNALAKVESPRLQHQALETLLKLMAPICPASAEEYWEKLLAKQGQKWSSIFAQDWPMPAEPLAVSNIVKYVVMINGKKALVHSSTTVDQAGLLEEIKAGGDIDRLLAKGIIRVIFRPEKGMLSIVTNK